MVKKMKLDQAAALAVEKKKRVAVESKRKNEKLKLMLAAKAAMKQIKDHAKK